MVLVTKRICIVVSWVSGCCDSRHEVRIDPASPTVGLEATAGPAPNGLSKPLRGLIAPRAIEILRLTARGYRFHVHGAWRPDAKRFGCDTRCTTSRTLRSSGSERSGRSGRMCAPTTFARRG